MPSQQEIDLEARIGDLERMVAELGAKVNPLYSGGMDRYIHSGYLQFDGIPMRWDPNGQQLETRDATGDVPAITWINRLSTDADTTDPRVFVAGRADPSTATFPNGIYTFRLRAENGERYGQVSHSLAGTGHSFMSLKAWGKASAPGGADAEFYVGYVPTADYHIFKFVGGQFVEILNGAPLFLGTGTSDPSVLQDGAIWYRSDTDTYHGVANGSVVTFGTGGGSMPMPPIVSTDSWHCIGTQLAAASIAAAASATLVTANQAIYVPLLVTEDITVKKLWWYNGATVSGNVNMALYTAAFAQVSGTETGSTAQAGTNVIQEVDIADTALTAGLYYIAIVIDNTTGTMFRYSPGTPLLRAWGVASEASVFDLPATATLADPIVPVPICGIATRTQVA